MKKKILVLGIIVMLLATLVILTGCGNTEEDNSKVEGDSVKATENKKQETSNIGKTVTNYTANEQKWKVFYEDDSTGRIYLIASDLVNSKYLSNSYKNGASNWEGGYSDVRIYNYEWNDSTKVSLETQNRQDSLFMATNYQLNENYVNSKCVSTLLNTDNWKDFVDTQYADYAIGGPTIEMFVASWNKKHDEKLYANNTNEYGYYIGRKEKPTEFFTYIEDDELYFIKYNEENYATGYWIASPSANDLAPGRRIMRASYGGDLNFAYPSDATYGVRPVVVLKEGVKLTSNNDGSVTLK